MYYFATPTSDTMARPKKSTRPFVRQALGHATPTPDAPVAQGPGTLAAAGDEPLGAPPYDETLLDRARKLWQFGDWESLGGIEQHSIEHHPERATLVLLVSTACQQLGDHARARRCVQLALDWGCDPRLISQVLVAGVHNTLACASALRRNAPRALVHFEGAVTGVAVDPRLASRARAAHELARIALEQPDLAVLEHSGAPVPGSGGAAPAPSSAVSDALDTTLSQIGAEHAKLQEQLGDHLIRLGQLLETAHAFQRFGAAAIVGECHATHAPRPSAHQPQGPLAVKQIACHNLGDAWAANTVNTVIFRHHGIFSIGRFQFTAFYVDQHTLRVVRRDLSDDTLDIFDLLGEYKLSDAHNSISLGCDREGYIHMSYDQHSTRLRYRRSAEPLDIQAWGDEIAMTGLHEDHVAYPSLILPTKSQPLLLLYRDGTWNKGTAWIKVYNEASRCWSDRPTPILSGADQRPWTCNAYWNHPITGSDGSLHLSFVWRTHCLGAEQRINNINVCYARSYVYGLSWQTSLGRHYKLPVTPVNAETVHPISPGSNLINQTSMALDSRNRPHIVFYSDDPDGIPQYQHLWFDGKIWRHQYVSKRKTAFVLMGGGTLQVPISRPEIVVDRQDNAYVIYRGDLTGGRMTVLRLAAPDYRFDSAQAHAVWDADLGYAEPVIDRTRWQQSNILTLLLQHNRQPDGDRSHDLLNMPVTLVDLQLH
jgi:hypothetical protein